jgi:glycine dehydrogenase subunit 1
LAVTAATIHMALLGPHGLKRVALASHANLLQLLESVARGGRTRRRFLAPVFHEAVISLDVPADVALASLRAQGILGGLDLANDYPELGASLLVCTTETKTAADLERYASALAAID